MNLQHLYHAQVSYSYRGWEVVDVPWVVPNLTQLVTAPSLEAIVQSDVGPLVGSAEQSFLSQIGTLAPDTRYQSVTPCFRKEPTLDVWHKTCFMKLELFCHSSSDGILMRTLSKALSEAEELFSSFLGVPVTRQKISSTEVDLMVEGIDLMVEGIELGSYGIREWGPHKWFYGTGLAEPRFTQCLHKVRAG